MAYLRKKGSPQRVASWVENQRMSVEGSSIELRADVMGSAAVVATWERGDVVSSPHEWAARALEAAQGDCDDREQDTRYALVHVRDGSDVSSHPLRMKPQEEAEPGTGLDGSLASLIGQLQRHQEATLRLLISSQASAVKAQESIIEMQARRIEQLESTRQRLVDAGATQSDDPEAAARRERLGQLVDIAVQAAAPTLAKMLMPDGMSGLADAAEGATDES